MGRSVREMVRGGRTGGLMEAAKGHFREALCRGEWLRRKL